eukprot:TRINITY_DN7325_c0_g1_i1.p1 TRINITY_DN7325_c0_g1~~TRINITY_DN7325_c0_g1_i1.p1  ORF type:complete len:540 (+),score=131.19 TRINITY_DN7325_c0_g1_i1:89-1708(+)
MNESDAFQLRRDANADELQRSLTSSRALLDEIIVLLSKSPDEEKAEILLTASEAKQSIQQQMNRLREMLDSRESALTLAIDQFASEKIIHAQSIRERLITQSSLIKDHYDTLKIIPAQTKSARSSKTRTHIARLNGATSRARLTIESRRADFGFEELLEASAEDLSAIHDILANPCQMHTRDAVQSTHKRKETQIPREGIHHTDNEIGDGDHDVGDDDQYLHGVDSTLTSVSLSNQHGLATDSDGDSTVEQDFDPHVAEHFVDDGAGITNAPKPFENASHPMRLEKDSRSPLKNYKANANQSIENYNINHPHDAGNVSLSHRIIDSSNRQTSRMSQNSPMDSQITSFSHSRSVDDVHSSANLFPDHDASSHVDIVDWTFHESRHGTGIQLTDANMIATNKSWFGTGYVVGDVVYNKGRFSFDVKINRMSSFVAVGFVTSKAVQLDYLHAYTWQSDGILSDSSGYGTPCPECSFREADVVTIDVDLDQSRANMKNYRTKQSISIDFHLASDLDEHFSPFIDIGSGSSVTLLCRREWHSRS